MLLPILEGVVVEEAAEDVSFSSVSNTALLSEPDLNALFNVKEEIDIAAKVKLFKRAFTSRICLASSDVNTVL